MRPNFSSGFTLIEILISLILLSLILFGFDAAEIFSLRETRGAYYFTVATNQLNVIIERLRALSNYDGLAEQIRLWNLQNKQVLPQGLGEVSGRFPYYAITIYWGEKQAGCKQIQLGQSGCLNEIITL